MLSLSSDKQFYSITILFILHLSSAPSRDNEFRTRLYSFDDQLLCSKYRTTPFSNAPG